MVEERNHVHLEAIFGGQGVGDLRLIGIADARECAASAASYRSDSRRLWPARNGTNNCRIVTETAGLVPPNVAAESGPERGRREPVVGAVADIAADLNMIAAVDGGREGELRAEIRLAVISGRLAPSLAEILTRPRESLNIATPLSPDCEVGTLPGGLPSRAASGESAAARRRPQRPFPVVVHQAARRRHSRNQLNGTEDAREVDFEQAAHARFDLHAIPHGRNEAGEDDTDGVEIGQQVVEGEIARRCRWRSAAATRSCRLKSMTTAPGLRLSAGVCDQAAELPGEPDTGACAAPTTGAEPRQPSPATGANNLGIYPAPLHASRNG